MVGEQKLKVHAAGLADRGRVRLYFDDLAGHAVLRQRLHGIHAGSLQRAAASLDDAHTARADFVDILHIAKGGNFDARLLRRLKDRGSGRNAYGNAINFEIDHIHLASS